MFDTVERIASILNKIGRLGSIVVCGDEEEIVTKELAEEITVTVRKWKKQINNSFDTFFIKQANIAVLYKKKKEIECKNE